MSNTRTVLGGFLIPIGQVKDHKIGRTKPQQDENSL